MNTSNNCEKYIEVSPGVNLHITDKGTGRPVVLIPGLPLSDEMFKYTYDVLVEHGYRAIGITLRGFGKSDASENYDLDVHANDVNTVLQALELEDAVLGGYSFGGIIAAYYAARYSNQSNVSKLILMSSNVPKFTRADDYSYGPGVDDVNQLIALSETNLGALLDVYGPVFHLTESFMSLSIGNWLNSINLQTTPKAMTQGLILLRDFDLRPVLGYIEIPTIIFHSTDDATVPFVIAEQALADIKNAQMVVFDKGGHWYIFVEQEKFYYELLKAIE
jgi:pimeloyl-ACP methyl ester carboxylesterase